MATIDYSSVTETTQQSSGSTLAITLPASGTYAVGDLLLSYVYNASGGTTISLGTDALTSVTAATDTFVYSGSDIFDNGIEVEFTGTLGTSLTAGTRYWVRDLNTGTKSFKVSATNGGAVFDVTGSPSGVTCHRMSGGASANNNCVGWNVLAGQAQTTNIRTAVLWKKTTSTTESNPTIVVTNNTANALSWVVKNVDGTTQVEASSIATAGSATSVTNNTATSGSENALAIFCGGHNSTTAQLRFKSSQATALNANVNLFSNRSTLVGFKQLGASSTTPSTTLYTTTSALNLQLWTIIIKNSSGGATMPWADSGLNELVWYGNHGSPLQAITNQAPANFCAITAGGFITGETYTILSVGTTDFTLIGAASNTVGVVFTATGAGTGTGTAGTSINGIGTTSSAATMDLTGTELDWGHYTGYSSTENFASPSSKFVGNYHAFTFPDLTGKIISFEWKSRQSAATSTQVASEGHVVGFTDGTNHAVYQIAPKTVGGWVTDQWERVTIEPGVTSTYDTRGSINWAAVTGVLYATHSASGSAGARECRVRNLVVFDKATIVGGGASYPATWEAAYRALTSCGFYKIARKQAASQYQFDCSVQIGDGSIATYFMPSPQAFEMSPPYNSKTQPWWRVAADKISLTIKAKASDTINLSASSLVTTQSALFSLDAASSTSATYNLQSLLVVGFNVTWSAAEDLTGATFKSGKTVNIAAAGTWTDAIVNSTASTNAAMSVTANSQILDGVTIDGTGAAYALELGTSVTAITLTDCTITAGSTDKVHVLATIGTVTITISGTTSLLAGDVTSAGATVVIAAPQLYQVVVVSGFTAGSRIQIYDTTNSTELFNGTASAGDTVVSGTTATWTDPLAASGTRAIRVRVSYVNGATAKQFIETSGLTCGITEGTESVTYPISQVADETYDNNGIDGPAIYATSGITFTDAATDLVNISIAGGAVTWPTIYACFVYWIFTAAGIDDDVAYIDAPDTANYLLTSMKLKNTHANPLTVTSGFGRSATTGLVADIIDAAGSTGNIYPTPDHVVAYATGSGALTAGDITNIWSAATRTITTTIPSDTDNAAAVLAAAQTTPIHADIRKVNNHTVDGVGSDADPWGPA